MISAIRRAAVALTLGLSMLAPPTAAAQAQVEYDPLGGPLQAVPSDLRAPPEGYRHTAIEAIRAAVATEAAKPYVGDPAVRIRPFVRPGARRFWVIFTKPPKVLLEVAVDDRTGRVVDVYEGFRADWYIARGSEGILGAKLNAPYVWLPLCALFLLPFLDWRRPTRLLHLDLLALLAFGASHWFFNRGEIETSVWLVYPVLAYLAFRLAVLGWSPARGRGQLVPWTPAWLLIAGVVALVAGRAALTLVFAEDFLMDVGYAGVIGAHRIVEGEDLYVLNDATGDTYGPVTYLAYIPFEQIWPWDGGITARPAARAAAFTFDLLTIAGLFVLGRRLRAGRAGTMLGSALAYAWTAYPYSALVVVAGTNDALVSALLVWALVLAASPVLRGTLVGLAAAAKFAPLAVLPVFALGLRRSLRQAVLAGGAAGAVIVLTIVPLLPDGGLREFWDATLGYQTSRTSPFSPWGQDAGWEPLQVLIEAAALCAIALTVVLPRPATIASLAALAGLVLIAVQAPAIHWLYFYVAWFAPFSLVAFASPYRTDPRKRLPGEH